MSIPINNSRYLSFSFYNQTSVK